MATDLKQLLLSMSKRAAHIAELTAELDNDKKRVKKFMLKTNRDNIKGDFGTVYTATKTTYEFDISALTNALDDQYVDEVVKRKYEVDVPALKKLCKTYGIPPKKLRAVISVEKYVDEAALNKLYDSGEISLEDIDGCYTTHETKTVGFRFK